MRISKRCMLGLGILALPVFDSAMGDSDGEDPDAIRAANLEAVSQWDRENREVAKQEPHIIALPRVRVDRNEKTVIFYAEATGIGVRDPVEFFLIGEKSGNAYEAIAVALADPGAIDEGLRLLGLPQGRASAPEQACFWPKGERVFLFLNGRRAEELLLDTRSGKPLPARGLVYTGSQRIPSTNGGPSVVAAHVRPPYAIAANYNEPDALLDVPWQAPQSAVYTHHAQNPEFRFAPGERVLAVIRPEYTDGRRRVQDLRLTLAPARPGAIGLADAQFRVENLTARTTELTNSAVDRLTALFAGMTDRGQDPFVEIHIRPDTPLGLAHETARLFHSIDTVNGIRIEPPPEGALYYRAFIPNERFRRREDRYLHPWEFHLETDNAHAVLVRIDEEWKQGDIKPEITATDIPVADAQALKAALTTQKPDVRGIYVYAPPEQTVGDLMSWIGPVLPTHPHIHVYLQVRPTGPAQDAAGSATGATIHPGSTR